MTQHTIDDVVRLLRAAHEVMHITHQQLASIEARIHALEIGQMTVLETTRRMTEQERHEILTMLKDAADRERGRIEKMVHERLDAIGDALAAPKPPTQN